MAIKIKWKNRILPRGVFVDPRGYVYVRKFHEGKAIPKKNFGQATPESVDAAIRYAYRLKENLRLGVISIEDQKVVRWPFPYAFKVFTDHKPQWKYFYTPLSSFFKDYYFDDIWFKTVEKYRPFRKSRGIMDSSINRELTALSSMYYTFKHLKLLGKIPNVMMPPENPTRGVVKVDETHMRRKRIITPVEFGQIMTEASPRLRRAILAALNTGLRMKDVYSLKRDAMDPYMTQLQGLMHKVGASYTTAANEVMKDLYASAEGDMVVDRVNQRREFRNLRKICQEKYGMPDFIFKDFRRTAAWTLWTQKKDIFAVMALLNHKDITMTQRYLGISSTDLEQAGRILASHFSYPIQTEPTAEPKNLPESLKVQGKTIE